MQAPTAAELLRAWELGAAVGPAGRAAVLVELACRDRPPEELDALPLGEREMLLLELRELLFGAELAGAVDCARCGKALEFSLSAIELRDDSGERPAALTLTADGYEVAFRLPTAGDLAAAAEAADVDAARVLLLERCVVRARHGGDEEAASALPDALVSELGERIAAADPLADVRAAFDCPDCGHAWSAPLDVGSWLWAEIEAWVRRLVLDVHALASAYGWSERDILALGPRRRLYLDLVGA